MHGSASAARRASRSFSFRFQALRDAARSTIGARLGCRALIYGATLYEARDAHGLILTEFLREAREVASMRGAAGIQERCCRCGKMRRIYI